MIHPSAFFKTLKQHQINMFFGVPDSLLANLCAYIDDQVPANRHRITANEGNALAMAAGYYLASGKVAAVYLQNSGLGNLVNPLTSLTDIEVYKIPALLIIGWRGEPGVKDEPQHVKQGRITPAMLDLLNIPYFVLDATSDYQQQVQQAVEYTQQYLSPVALLVRKSSFAEYTSCRDVIAASTMTREEALALVLDNLSGDEAVISTTGKTSREVFELRKQRGESQRDFLTVGAMGHTSSIALGVAMARPERSVVCIDGDGSMLMHLGAMAIIGSVAPTNLLHLVLNNQSHESVGGQPTVAGEINIGALAASLNYKYYLKASTALEVNAAMQQAKQLAGPILLEVLITQGSRDNLGRPDSSAEQNKIAFMRHIHAST